MTKCTIDDLKLNGSPRRKKRKGATKKALKQPKKKHVRNTEAPKLERPDTLDDLMPFLEEADEAGQCPLSVDELDTVKTPYPRGGDEGDTTVNTVLQVAVDAIGTRCLNALYTSEGGEVDDAAKEVLAEFVRRTKINITMEVLVSSVDLFSHVLVIPTMSHPACVLWDAA